MTIAILGNAILGNAILGNVLGVELVCIMLGTCIKPDYKDVA